MKQIILAVVGLCLVTACSILPEPERVRIYHLPAPSEGSVVEAEQRLPYSLEVRLPETVQAFDSARLSVFQTAQGQAYWQNLRLADRAPILVASRIVQELRASSAFDAVTHERDGAAGELILLTELGDFSVRQQSGQNVARVELHVGVLQRSNRQSLAAESFSAEVEFRSGNADEAVAAMSTALSEVNRQLLDWLVQLPD